MAVHSEAVDSGEIGGSSPGRAMAGEGASAMGGAEIPVPGNGISLRCGWIWEESAAPMGEG